VNLAIRRGRGQESGIVFAVTDTGIGISPENLKTIFGAFEQGDGTTSRSYGGTGLGLAICREVASHLGGSISAESHLGAGSTFTLLLPPSYRAAPDERVTGAEREQRDPDDATGEARPEAAGVADTAEVTPPRQPARTAATRPGNGATPRPGNGATATRGNGATPRPGTFGTATTAKSKAAATPATAPSIRPVAAGAHDEDASKERSRPGAGPGRSAGPGASGPPVPSQPAAAARMAPVSSGPHDALQGRKVLIIDDDVRNVFAITSILELYGITVTHAPDGRKGIDTLVASDDIDLVLMDVMMPEMDGYTTTAAIRSVPRFADLPVIAVTARAMPADRAKSLTTGATDYVTKPVDTEELLNCMERCLPDGQPPAAG
jgi:CheY-like chemotaxis protein